MTPEKWWARAERLNRDDGLSPIADAVAKREREEMTPGAPICPPWWNNDAPKPDPCCIKAEAAAYERIAKWHEKEMQFLNGKASLAMGNDDPETVEHCSAMAKAHRESAAAIRSMK